MTSENPFPDVEHSTLAEIEEPEDFKALIALGDVAAVRAALAGDAGIVTQAIAGDLLVKRDDDDRNTQIVDGLEQGRRRWS